MNPTLLYILSQIFIILNYVFLVITYQLKNKEKILLFSIAAQSACGLSYICLSAYTGLAMSLISIFRNVIFIINEEKNGVTEKTTTNEILMLLVIYALTIILSVITFNGFLSLLSVFATMLYTFSVWQKSTLQGCEHQVHLRQHLWCNRCQRRRQIDAAESHQRRVGAQQRLYRIRSGRAPLGIGPGPLQV